MTSSPANAASGSPAPPGSPAPAGSALLPAEPYPKPKFNYKPKFGIIVVCADEAEQQRRYDDLKARGLKCKVVVV